MQGITLTKAPQKGLMLAYLQGGLLFEPYEIEDGRIVFDGCDAYQDFCPAECHLFDTDTEYRMIFRESRGDTVEVVLTRQQEDAMDPDLIFVEEPLVREELAQKPGIPKRVKVVNRYAYTPNDTLVLSNYRISY